MSNGNRRSGLMPGRIEVPLKRVEKPGKPTYYIGEWGDSEITVNLGQVKFLLFDSRHSAGDKTLMIGDKEKKDDL